MDQALFQNLVSGMLVGSLYGLAAMGLSLVFGVLKILNVAHGELLMIGGYVTFWAFQKYGIDPILGVFLVVPLLFFIGVVLHMGLFRNVVQYEEEHRIKNSMLIGFGLTLVFQALAIELWTADEQSVTTSYSLEAFEVAGLRFPLVRLAPLVVGIILVVLMQWFLKKTYWGKAIRATAENWQSASLTGINIRQVYLLTFAIGTALAGLAGTLVVVGFSINPSIGLQWTLKALIVVVLAGLGSIPGTFLAGIFLGVAESLGAYAFDGQYRELVSLVIFLIVLTWRPQGFFGAAHG
jgi:branched-chain amino acid transport system permease protein